MAELADYILVQDSWRETSLVCITFSDLLKPNTTMTELVVRTYWSRFIRVARNNRTLWRKDVLMAWYRQTASVARDLHRNLQDDCVCMAMPVAGVLKSFVFSLVWPRSSTWWRRLRTRLDIAAPAGSFTIIFLTSYSHHNFFSQTRFNKTCSLEPFIFDNDSSKHEDEGRSGIQLGTKTRAHVFLRLSR